MKTEDLRQQDLGQLNHTRNILQKAIGQLQVAINLRSKFGKELMGNTGDRAGTGHLSTMLNQLEQIEQNWDEETKLYGN